MEKYKRSLLKGSSMEGSIVILVGDEWLDFSDLLINVRNIYYPQHKNIKIYSIDIDAYVYMAEFITPLKAEISLNELLNSICNIAKSKCHFIVDKDIFKWMDTNRHNPWTFNKFFYPQSFIQKISTLCGTDDVFEHAKYITNEHNKNPSLWDPLKVCIDKAIKNFE